jgi:hypothetical protein
MAGRRTSRSAPVGAKRASNKRKTLNKQIASAPTLAKKWEIALHGGAPPTKIQQLASEAFGLASPSLHGPEWQSKALQQLKQKFADVLFPALVQSSTGPFEELIQAIRNRSKKQVSLNQFIQEQDRLRKLRPSKKEIGRRLRLALLSLSPDDLLNIRSVKAALGKVEQAFQKWHGFDFSLAPDDSKIYAVMKELNIGFLRPGDAARWIFNGKVVRILSIQADGKSKTSGMTLKQIETLGGYVCQTNFHRDEAGSSSCSQISSTLRVK